MHPVRTIVSKPRASLFMHWRLGEEGSDRAFSRPAGSPPTHPLPPTVFLGELLHPEIGGFPV